MSDAWTWTPLSQDAPDHDRDQRYREVRKRVETVLEHETNWVAALATVACELHHAFGYFDWTGFYCVAPGKRQELVIGPYQGTHGCLRIPFDRGVCGAAASERKTQLVDDVSQFPGHIACSTTTRSEIVVPVLSGWGKLMAVLDVDSNTAAVFNHVDKRHLESLCEWLGSKYEAEVIV